MMAVLEPLLFLAGLMLAVPGAVLCIQAFMARRPAAEAAPENRPPAALLIPAHDEAAVIGDTVRALRAQMGPADRLLVVADNCTDDTATRAAEAGAEVAERHDADRRGKGYALDFGLRELARDGAPPAYVVFIDADCRLADGSLDHLVACCADSGRPVQAVYLMRSSAGARLGQRIGELAWTFKNLVRPLGAWRLGLPCQLMGSGMAFSWKALGHAPLASGNIVEDLQLGLDLARAGVPPLFCPQALVESRFPDTERALRSQRRRWEHGHLSVILREAPRLLARSLIRRDRRLGALALDLAVPPLASLVMAQFALFAAALLMALLTHHPGPAIAAALGPALTVAAVVAGWWRHGRSIVTGWELLGTPAYAWRKIPVYLGWFARRQTAWVRTERSAGLDTTRRS